MGEYTCENSLNSFKEFLLLWDYIQGFGAFKLLYEYCLWLSPFSCDVHSFKGGREGAGGALYQLYSVGV